MKKVLFILGTYFPKPSANGICVHEVIKSCYKRGYEVSVLTTNINEWPHEEKTEYAHIYRINDDPIIKKLKKGKGIVCKILRFFTKLTGLIKLLFYYNISTKRLFEFKKMASKIIEDGKIDTVIAVVQPIEAFVAIPYIKKKFDSIKIAPYLLDIPNEKQFRFKILDKIWQKKTEKLYKGIFPYCDKVFTMECTKQYFNKNNFQNFHHKIEYVDIPLFRKVILETKDSPHFDHRKKNIVFAGTMSKQIRNPERILSIFVEIRKYYSDFVLHFYGSGCDDIMDKYKLILGDSMILYGRVDLDNAYLAMNNADILLNISNKTNYQIPSKIFEYFATGKPIINYSFSKHDIANQYYEKYPNIYHVEDWIEYVDLNDLINFIRDSKTIKDEKGITIAFEKNTPSYFVNYLERM